MRAITIILGLSLALSCGCGGNTGNTSAELARVAKDWSLGIRASQVIPVYPLTEDVQPGDIFLVRTPIGREVKLYESKGFLPLENHMERLQPLAYNTFYADGYGIDNGTRVPRHWQFPTSAPAAPPTTSPTAFPSWWNAPRASFPSYTFTIKRGEGLSLALPVQGVPVGLNLLGAGNAYGSITIADAFTYGIDERSLRELVSKWAYDETTGVKELLLSFATDISAPSRQGENSNWLNPIKFKEKDNVSYLRVVTRVYLTGRVNISMFNDEASGGSLSAGAAKTPVAALDLTQVGSGKDVTANYAKVNEVLDQELGTAPGGSVRVAAASSRSVSLVETFPRPLVVGYLAYDLPVLKQRVNGRDELVLGAPLSTQKRVTNQPIAAARQSPAQMAASANQLAESDIKARAAKK